jgi:hypothetical protein
VACVCVCVFVCVCVCVCRACAACALRAAASLLWYTRPCCKQHAGSRRRPAHTCPQRNDQPPHLHDVPRPQLRRAAHDAQLLPKAGGVGALELHLDKVWVAAVAPIQQLRVQRHRHRAQRRRRQAALPPRRTMCWAAETTKAAAAAAAVAAAAGAAAEAARARADAAPSPAQAGHAAGECAACSTAIARSCRAPCCWHVQGVAQTWALAAACAGTCRPRRRQQQQQQCAATLASRRSGARPPSAHAGPQPSSANAPGLADTPRNCNCWQPLAELHCIGRHATALLPGCGHRPPASTTPPRHPAPSEAHLRHAWMTPGTWAVATGCGAAGLASQASRVNSGNRVL